MAQERVVHSPLMAPCSRHAFPRPRVEVLRVVDHRALSWGLGQEPVRDGQCLVQDRESRRSVNVAHVERWRDVDAVTKNQR